MALVHFISEKSRCARCFGIASFLHNINNAPKDNLLRGSQDKGNATCFSLQSIYQNTTDYGINKNSTPTKLEILLWWRNTSVLGLGRNFPVKTVATWVPSAVRRNKDQIPAVELYLALQSDLTQFRRWSQICQEEDGLLQPHRSERGSDNSFRQCSNWMWTQATFGNFLSVSGMRYKVFEMSQGKTFIKAGNRNSQLFLWTGRAT